MTGHHCGAKPTRGPVKECIVSKRRAERPEEVARDAKLKHGEIGEIQREGKVHPRSVHWKDGRKLDP